MAGKEEKEVEGGYKVLAWCLGKDGLTEKFKRRSCFGEKAGGHVMFERLARAM